MSQPNVVAGEETQPSRSTPGWWGGAALLLAVGLQLIAAFLPYLTARVHVPSEQPISISSSLYDLLDGGRPVFFLTLALTAALGSALVFRPNSIGRALVGGFCVSMVGYTAFAAVAATAPPSTFHFGVGFFLSLASSAIEASVAVWMLVAVASSFRTRSVMRRSDIALALTTGLAAGIAVESRDLRISHGEPLAVFTPLSFKLGAAALIAFVAVAAVALLAARARSRTGSALAVGLAVYMSVRVLDALVRRFVFGTSSPLRQLTIGFWIEILAVALLVATALRLAPPGQEPRAAGETPRLVI